MTCKCGREMNETGPAYYLSNNYYQKYLCPVCNKTKVKVLNGYSKGGKIKV